jgi:hypothetical protein
MAVIRSISRGRGRFCDRLDLLLVLQEGVAARRQNFPITLLMSTPSCVEEVEMLLSLRRLENIEANTELIKKLLKDEVASNL